MKLLSIENQEILSQRFHHHQECLPILEVFTQHYKKAGFVKPWIAYFVSNEQDEIIGGGGFKSQPQDNKVEITYGIFEKHQGQGLGITICKELVNLRCKPILPSGLWLVLWPIMMPQ